MSAKSKLKKIVDDIGALEKPIIIGSCDSEGVYSYRGELMSKDQFHERFPDDQYKIVIFDFGFPFLIVRGGDL